MPYHQTLGQNPLRDGVPWEGWSIVAATTALFVVVAAVGFERRDTRQ